MDDFTASDAERVLGIALFRQAYKDEPGSLPSNGTMGDIAFEEAFEVLRRCPGLRYVLEAGVRALAEDHPFQSWLVPIYAGGAQRCAETEAVLAATFGPDPEPDPSAMTADEIADTLIADLHERYA